MEGKEQKQTGTHRKLEGWWITFTVLVFLGIMVGTLVELVPIILIYDKTPTISTVKPFTPLEVIGRDIYIREGCNNCHSQMVRPFKDELERYDPAGTAGYSKAGETIYEHPFLWGSKRTGPDLARVGGKYNNMWHVIHMENPRATSPNSIMPPYDWLLRKDLDYASIPARVSTLQSLGVPYTDDELANAVEIAKAQAEEIQADVLTTSNDQKYNDLAKKEIVALVAFLQRLGQDVRAANTAVAEE